MTGRDTDVLARTLVGEARGEGHAGMECVANVIMNRCAVTKAYVKKYGRYHPLFGDGTPASACLKPWQFSCWNANDPNRAIIEALGEDKSIFREALEISRKAVAGDLADRTDGATHYYARSLKTPPKWAAGKTPCHTEGAHLFFKDV